VQSINKTQATKVFPVGNRARNKTVPAPLQTQAKLIIVESTWVEAPNGVLPSAVSIDPQT
jgi:hypothetical protein